MPRATPSFTERDRTADHRGTLRRRWIEPVIGVIVEPTLLSNPMSGMPGLAIAWQSEVRFGNRLP
jgi:hypothetical protein